MKNLILIFFLSISVTSIKASQILIPMDDAQTNHLKSYGIAFWMLENDVVIEWLLNYRGGSFMCPNLKKIEEELIIRNVKYEIISDGQANSIRTEIANPEVNQEFWYQLVNKNHFLVCKDFLLMSLHILD